MYVHKMIGSESGDPWRSAGGSPGESVLRYLPKTIICQNVQVWGHSFFGKFLTSGFFAIQAKLGPRPEDLQKFKVLFLLQFLLTLR
jgi:hypothetical protein